MENPRKKGLGFVIGFFISSWAVAALSSAAFGAVIAIGVKTYNAVIVW